MTPRNREILKEIVEAYIATGEPIASRAIARRWHDSLSAASIRNAMADLDEDGYLSQPHTSAGRVPTEKAFRVYVEALTMRRLATAQIEQLRAGFGALNSMEARMEHTSHMLTELTNGMGIAAAIPHASRALESVELVALPDRRVLMVVATTDHQVHNRVVTLEESIAPEALTSIRNYLNQSFSGWRLEDVRRELAARLEQAEATYDVIFKKLTVLYSKGLLDVGPVPEVHVEGAANLFAVDLHLTREKMAELFRTLEEKKLVLDLLDRFLAQTPGEPSVHVGLGEMHPAMRQLSLIGLPVILPGGMSAVFAVLGPMRMNYSRVISAVQHVGAALQSA